jgi:hypothetical protein
MHPRKQKRVILGQKKRNCETGETKPAHEPNCSHCKNNLLARVVTVMNKKQEYVKKSA